jgi:hypothetical protein
MGGHQLLVALGGPRMWAHYDREVVTEELAPWRGDRGLYRDVWLVSQQAWCVAEVARRTAAHPAIAAWLLVNEMPIYGRNGDEQAVTAWARLLVQTLRSSGATQVSTGTGAGA